MRTTTLLVTVKNDPVPGTFHTPESVQEQVQAMLNQAIPHYTPEVEIALDYTVTPSTDSDEDFERFLLKTTLRQVLAKFQNITAQMAAINQERDEMLATGKPWVPTPAQMDVIEEVERLSNITTQV